MSPELKAKVNGNLTLIISASTLVMVATGFIHMGRQFERLEQHYHNDWCVSEMEVWTTRTEKANPTWKAEDVRRIHNEVSKP